MTVVWVALAAVLLLLFCVGNYFYDFALNPRCDKSGALKALPQHAQACEAQLFAALPPKDAYIRSFDGLKLHALALRQPGKKWALMQHGYTSAAAHMETLAAGVAPLGFNILLPDARGHGQSEGSYIGMGWDDRRDILQWLDWILQEEPEAEILLYGISMGGAAVMMTAGEALPPNVKCIIEDCGYASVWEEFRYHLTEVFHLPRPVATLVLLVSNVVTRLRAGYSLRASAVEQLKRAKVPMLFIHGEEDRYVPFFMLDEVYAAAPVPKQRLAVRDAGHGTSAVVAPELYWNTVHQFMHMYLK